MKRLTITGLAVGALCLSPVHSAPPQAACQSAIASLSRRVTVEFASRSLKDALAVVKDITLLDIQPLWKSDQADGLDPAAEVSIFAHNEPAASLLERIVERADPSGASTWQLSLSGAVQIGPRDRLNAFKRTHIYEVRDLIRITPDHRRGPSIDLQQALQKSAGSPITDTGADWLERLPPGRERALELADLIRSTVEPTQWKERGGDGASIFVYGETLIITAPDYIHRAIAAGTSSR